MKTKHKSHQAGQWRGDGLALLSTASDPLFDVFTIVHRTIHRRIGSLGAIRKKSFVISQC